MRNEPNLRAEKYRRIHPVRGGSGYGVNWGWFIVGRLQVMSSGSGEWEHVSVSLPDRCPTWEEMCRVKGLFWRDDEAVIQIHPPKDIHINHHPFCLHLWRNCGSELMLPPLEMV
jgi:hypothetical protein